MPSNLHLPEWRVTRIVVGVPSESMQGYYVRAANGLDAKSAVRALEQTGPNGKKYPMFSASESLRVERWKEPLYREVKTSMTVQCGKNGIAFISRSS